MNRYIAFLRAINITGHYVKMDHLRGLFASLGYANIETFIASGNVIFDSPLGDTQALEEEIARHLHASLGYGVATFLRSPREVAAIAAHQPFPGAAERGLSVAFLPASPAEAAQHALMAFENETDSFHIHNREVYWLRQEPISASTFSGARLEKALRMPATVRNITTVRRLAAKYRVPGDA